MSLRGRAEARVTAEVDGFKEDYEGAGSELGNSAPERVLKCGSGLLEVYYRCNEMYQKTKDFARDPMQFLKTMFKNQMTEKLYLSLVCELCWKSQQRRNQV